MSNKIPEIYKNKIEKLKTKVQKEFYYHSKDEQIKEEDNNEVMDKKTLLEKINAIFKRPDYVYQADVIIMYKNGKNKHKKIVGLKDNYLITLDNEKIIIDDIKNIKIKATN